MKRLGTGDHYGATSDGVPQVAWTNQEPPAIFAGECQLSGRYGVRFEETAEN